MSVQPPNPISDGADRVEISVPFHTRYFATMRTLAAALGADAGFSVDEIDDLRLAISEVVSSLSELHESGGGSGVDRIEASFEVGGDRIAVSISTSEGVGELVLDDLATGILESVVDEHQVQGSSVRLVKRAAEQTDARAET